jgi:hypothetical protein
MIIEPLEGNKARSRVSKTVQLPACTKGWYVGANITEAPPGSAYILQNAFPQLDYVRARRGSAVWTSSGMPSSTVSTLMPWQNGVSSKMFAACGTAIYDVSSSGAATSSVTGLGNVFLQYTQFQGIGGSYLFAVNGTSTNYIWDGTGWNRTFAKTGNTTVSTAVVTSLGSTTGLYAGMGVTGANIPANTNILSVDSGTQVTLTQNASSTTTGEALTFYQNPPITGTSPITGATPVFSNVNVFKNRLYFVEANTLNVWYLAVQAIGGAATVFPMYGIFRNGGYIVATASWAIDSTSGIYEGWVAITSEGEVAMYNGSDPSSWTLAGVYKISKPLGPRCFYKAGGDLMIMTEDGIVPMSKVETLDQIALQNVAVTLPIAPAWRQAVLDRIGTQGWQIMMWPLESMGIINLPKASASDTTQFIVNARTGAWSKYIGWDANCFAVYNNSLYFGTSDGRVFQGETGGSDNGSNYTVVMFPSFTNLNKSVNRKQVKMVHPYITSNVNISFPITINVDYNTTLPNPPGASTPTGGGALWDSALWDLAVWPTGTVLQNQWQMATAFGSSFSPIMQITLSSSSITPDIRFMRTDVLYEDGALIA